MDFTSFAKSDSINDREENMRSTANYDHFVDPYIRRYHIIKIAIRSLTLGVFVYLTKSIAQNLRNRKFYKLSPWIQLMFVTGAFSIAISEKYQTSEKQKQQLLALRQFKRTHFFNSQYWH